MDVYCIVCLFELLTIFLYNYASLLITAVCSPPGSYSVLPVEVPQNHKRFICDLTQADRLALYDYVVEETKKQRSKSQITENDSDLFVDLAAKITQGLKNGLLLNLWLRAFTLCS